MTSVFLSRELTTFLALVGTLPAMTHASPISLAKRSTSSMPIGARVGLGIGIAIVAILIILVTVFFAMHVRRRQHNAAINLERAILAGEKNKDGSDKLDKFAPQPPPSNMKRSKSVKDRLMGPLYRGSTIEMPVRSYQRDSRMPEDDHHWTEQDGQPFLHKPFAHDSSPRPSFSSKRATRMMMMM